MYNVGYNYLDVAYVENIRRTTCKLILNYENVGCSRTWFTTQKTCNTCSAWCLAIRWRKDRCAGGGSVHVSVTAPLSRLRRVLDSFHSSLSTSKRQHNPTHHTHHLRQSHVEKKRYSIIVKSSVTLCKAPDERWNIFFPETVWRKHGPLSCPRKK